ncbi:recombinase family protein [Bacillus licheniformis]|uniref:recombinase family protein n=1 Tax=Bacillus TaxID=1386 RepID=UPI000A0FDD30|nr:MULTISPECIES: recombinase family protein [Bacillus]MBA1163628.1 recombinase family protein [Bacillus licheniformis]MBS2762873.1 recombinase family protein [Bacillus licheniformis]MDE1449865.1 recombinase family protein [Bacillus licheniformis]MEC2098576.1 recombinase family protein [Bacillus paralicheniformis]MEC2114667.1 recombinase family protein [Bacillus paralicheniformis]
MRFNRTAIYLRKSRADMEAEAKGEGETLEKHKKHLLEYAKNNNLNIVKIRKEIVSGDKLFNRPEMMQLLKEVEEKKYDSVLVIDIERLGRGNMQEQGLILETFKESDTKIITPLKIYDLNNEIDEEHTEFETFMSRRELKKTTRRLQRGRIDSVKEGNYLGTHPPYGYEIVKSYKTRTLAPVPEESKIVKLIYSWYTDPIPEKRLGSSAIANKLNEMGVKTKRGRPWHSSSVLAIIKNAIYAGRIQWKKKDIKRTGPGKKEARTRPKEEWIDVEGKHEALISLETFNKAQEILKTKYHVPYHLISGITNPLAGLIRCNKCGASMIYRPYTKQKPHLKCYNAPRCQNKASNFELIEQRLLQGLQDWLADYKAQWDLFENQANEENEKQEVEIKKAALASLKNELKQTEKQKIKLFELLERGIYSEEIFLERSQVITTTLDELKTNIKKIEQELKTTQQQKKQNIKDILPHYENILDLYFKTDDPKKKNAMLKSILHKAVYNKEKHQMRDEFELVIYPKLPEQNQPILYHFNETKTDKV